MGRELDSEMLRRLQDNYREMSDGELLWRGGEARRFNGCGARGAPRGDGGPEAEGGGCGDGILCGGWKRDPLPKPEVGPEMAKGMVVLTTFYDAIAAGEACDWLEADGMDVDVRDVSQKGGLGTAYGGPPVSLQVIVGARDRERAMRILRQKMGLFPLQEVEEADAVVDDGTVSVVGFFGGARMRTRWRGCWMMRGSGIGWWRNAGGEVEDENAFSLEVREVDMVMAGDVVEKAYGLG